MRRRKLDHEFQARGLMRPTQFKKRIPRDEWLDWEMVVFPWGDQNVHGYRKADA